MTHQLLPKEEWTTPQQVSSPRHVIINLPAKDANPVQDTNYLSSIIKEIEADLNEREDLESMIVQKRQKQ